MPKKESSLIKGFQYLAFHRVLLIRFVNEELYAYFDVPKNVVNDFQEAESAGQYFHKYIKDEYLFKHIEI